MTPEAAKQRLAEVGTEASACINHPACHTIVIGVLDAVLAEPDTVMAALGAVPAVRMGGLAPAWYPQDDDDSDEPDGWIVPVSD